MLLDLEGGVLALEAADLGALDRADLLGEGLAGRGAEDLVALERVQRRAERRRQSMNAAPAPLGLGHRVGVDERRLAGLALGLDAVEARGEDGAERQVGIV